MTPQDAKVIAEFLMSDLEHEMSLTTGVLAAVPTDRLDYTRPALKDRPWSGAPYRARG